MHWLNRLMSELRFKVVRGTSFPKANLLSCLLNLAKRGLEVREIVDVGAHKAKWSRVAERVFPQAGYTLIEPIAELQPYLARFCRGHANRRHLAAGAGSQAGEQEFTVYPDRSASSFIVHRPEKRSTGQQRMVPVVTLDDVVAEHLSQIPDIVKIDAEGFEQEVIKGGSSLLGRTELFFLEAHFFGAPENPSSVTNIVQFMAERDYVPYDFTWFGRRTSDGALTLCEAAFARRNGILRAGIPTTSITRRAA